MTDPYRTADPDAIIEKLREEIAGLKKRTIVRKMSDTKKTITVVLASLVLPPALFSFITAVAWGYRTGLVWLGTSGDNGWFFGVLLAIISVVASVIFAGFFASLIDKK